MATKKTYKSFGAVRKIASRLIISSVATFVAIRWLIKSRSLYHTLNHATEKTALANIEIDYWSNLTRFSRGIDEFIITELQEADGSHSIRREQCVQLIILACLENILPQIDEQHKRVAFLTYPDEGDSFVLLKGYGIDHETHNDIKRKLTVSSGLPAQAINTKKTVYVNDVAVEEAAREKGYVAVSRIPKFRSIVCTPVYLSTQPFVPIGVIAADCKVPDAFSDADLKVLEHFATKIRLVWSAFPHASEQNASN